MGDAKWRRGGNRECSNPARCYTDDQEASDRGCEVHHVYLNIVQVNDPSGGSSSRKTMCIPEI